MTETGENVNDQSYASQLIIQLPSSRSRRRCTSFLSCANAHVGTQLLHLRSHLRSAQEVAIIDYVCPRPQNLRATNSFKREAITEKIRNK
jgi:hypothetical protein